MKTRQSKHQAKRQLAYWQQMGAGARFIEQAEMPMRSPFDIWLWMVVVPAGVASLTTVSLAIGLIVWPVALFVTVGMTTVFAVYLWMVLMLFVKRGWADAIIAIESKHRSTRRYGPQGEWYA